MYWHLTQRAPADKDAGAGNWWCPSILMLLFPRDHTLGTTDPDSMLTLSQEKKVQEKRKGAPSWVCFSCHGTKNFLSRRWICHLQTILAGKPPVLNRGRQWKSPEHFGGGQWILCVELNQVLSWHFLHPLLPSRWRQNQQKWSPWDLFQKPRLCRWTL